MIGLLKKEILNGIKFGFLINVEKGILLVEIPFFILEINSYI